MSKDTHRPSLLGGLLWAGLGVLFLLRNFGIGPDFWSLAARYWPILLILLGLGKVIDYYRQKEGVSLRIGEVVGILILLLVGTAVTRISNSHVGRIFRELPISIGGTHVRPGQWLGTSYSYNVEESYPLSAPTPLRIENSNGSVTVIPGSDQEVRVRLRKVVFQNEESRAKAIAEEIKLEAGPEGTAEATTFVVRTNRDALAERDLRFNTDLEVLVPAKSSVKVQNSFGEVKATNLEGKLDLSTSHNDLEIRDCSGEFLASNRYGDSRLINLTGNVTVEARGRVVVESVRGDVQIRNEYSPVEVRDIQGAATVFNTESSILLEKVSKPVVIEARGTQVTVNDVGDTLKLSTSHRRVRVSEVGGGVQLDTSYANIAFKKIKGPVEISSNSDRLNFEELGDALKIKAKGSVVTADGVAGAVDIQTTLRDVAVSNFGGACFVISEFGDVTLSTETVSKGEIKVKNKNGSIELILPDAAAFEIQADARNGRVDTDYAGLQPAEAPSGGGSLKGRMKSGGPKITLDTEYGNIRLRARGSQVAQER
jgi:hypothetical protein